MSAHRPRSFRAHLSSLALDLVSQRLACRESAGLFGFGFGFLFSTWWTLTFSRSSPRPSCGRLTVPSHRRSTFIRLRANERYVCSHFFIKRATARTEACSGGRAPWVGHGLGRGWVAFGGVSHFLYLVSDRITDCSYTHRIGCSMGIGGLD